VIELARKAYARIKAQRNGHVAVERPPGHPETPQTGPGREKSEKSPPDVRSPNELPGETHFSGCEKSHPLNAKKAPSPPAFRLVKDQAELATVVADLHNTAQVGLDLETSGLHFRTDRVRLLQLAVDTTDGGTFVYVLDLFALDPAPLWEALAGKALVIHNASFDLAFLSRLGFTPAAPVHDTLLLARLLTAGGPDRQRNGL
jgi:DNA polymerase III epsilon subunit-like protein